MKPGAAIIREPAQRKVRDKQIMEARLTGMTYPAIAKQFNVSKNTVERSVKRAIAEGLVQSAEEAIVSDLVPLAIKVYREKLEKDKDPFVAKHVLDQLGKMAERIDNRQQHVESMTLDAYFKLRTHDKAGAAGDSSSDSASDTGPDIVVEALPPGDVTGDD